MNLRLEGIGVSAGIVIGTALLYGGRPLTSLKEEELSHEEAREEVRRFKEALRKSEEELGQLRKRVGEVLGEKDARIFDSHLMMVGDRSLIQEVIKGIRQDRRRAEFVFNKTIQRYEKALNAVDDEYIKDRITDIRDVANRVLKNLGEGSNVDLSNLPHPRIIVAEDLSPSDTASMDSEKVQAFVTRIGSRTSHTAIMAHSLNIPAVLGIPDILELVNDGDQVIVDGLRGEVVIRPDEETIKTYEKKQEAQKKWLEVLEAEQQLPPETIDGFRVQLAANIELPSEVKAIRQSYGVGIGLFRTEYLFVNRETFPSEEEQFQAYRDVAENIYPESVIFRTLDLGGDKFLSQGKVPREFNPFLGKRAIRFCLSRPEMFKCQLRAILRASAYGKVRLMFPMIATLEEILEAKEYLEEAKSDLHSAQIPFNPDLDVGIMIEISSAALTADKLIPHVDFFSIGTNDLIQYSMAVDRANPDIAYLYQPSHPSVIRLLRHVVHAAYSHSKWVSICGEVAGEPVLVPLILGLGIHELSMSAASLNVVKKLIRSVRIYDAEHLVYTAMQCGTSDRVRNMCEDFVQDVAPELSQQV